MLRGQEFWCYESGLVHAGALFPLGSRKAWAGGRWGLCMPSEMVTFPAPPQHPAALDYCQGSAWPKRETSYVLAPGTHLQGRTLSTKPHPLPNLSDELPQDKRLQTFQEASTPRHFLQSFNLTWRKCCCPLDISTWGQGPGTSWGRSRHPCID